MTQKLRTVSDLPFGLHPKAVLAFLFPLISTLAVAVAVWVAGGDLDLGPVRLAAAALIEGGLALLGAYVGRQAPAAPLVPVREHELRDLHDEQGGAL